ncbi:hypothetical protein [Bradyrhizobium genosp. A]|uniref:hypothetical protein n=1 Tax=Bradyrhizobium genosp. A TaxID=83626 RepID=UPI003CEFAD8F
MKTILGRQYAAPASSAAICKTTIKEITLVLNGDTHVARCEEFFCRRILSQRTNTRHEMEHARDAMDRFISTAKKWPGQARP